MTTVEIQPDLTRVREAMAAFDLSPHADPDAPIALDRVFFPKGHRGVLDLKRQLVVGNRGMGKSFWTHALTNIEVRKRVAKNYAFPALEKAEVVVGFNGSDKLSGVTPTIDEIRGAQNSGHHPNLIWRAVILRAVQSLEPEKAVPSLTAALNQLRDHPSAYAEELTAADESNAGSGSFILVVFDALDRLSQDWTSIRELTKGLLITMLGLQSFRSIRAKVFMRVDQFADRELFRFPDSSKILNDRVDLTWQQQELYDLLLFELMRDANAISALKELDRRSNTHSALPIEGHSRATPEQQEALVKAIAGEFMGRDRKRGRVYTWVPLHLGDAKNTCSPRTFLTAWKTAAENPLSHQGLAVDYRGLIEGVRKASRARLNELREDYPWIDLALEPMRSHFVPIPKSELFALWQEKKVYEGIETTRGLTPIGFIENSLDALLRTMVDIAVMEERANGKINVPDIFRVEAGILRRGGVAVPRKN